MTPADPFRRAGSGRPDALIEAGIAVDVAIATARAAHPRSPAPPTAPGFFRSKPALRGNVCVAR